MSGGPTSTFGQPRTKNKEECFAPLAKIWCHVSDLSCSPTFSMNFLEHETFSPVSGTLRTRYKQNVMQFELVNAELCPKTDQNAQIILAQLDVILALVRKNFSCTKCRITLRGQLSWAHVDGILAMVRNNFACSKCRIKLRGQLYESHAAMRA